MNPLRCLCLDLDGTLAASLPALRAAYGRFLDQQGLPATSGEFEKLNGPPLTDVVAMLKHSHELSTPQDELLSAYEQLVSDAYRGVQPTEGGEVLLRAARRAGWSTVVVTSNSSEMTQAWLVRNGLAHLIDSVVGGEMTERGKPFPDPYLAAVPSGSSAGSCVAVEDSKQGAEAALSAGLRTFLYAAEGAPTPDMVELPKVEGVVSRLDQLVDVLF